MAPLSDRDRDNPSDTDQPKPENPFIKFRQFADAQIGSLLQGIIGLPSAFSKRPSENGRWADFDDDLRRRDELQTRQRDLGESETRRLNKQALDQRADLPDKRLPHWESSSGWNENSSSASQEINGAITKDVPLYSPVTKSLFAHLRQPGDEEVDWMKMDRFSVWDKSFLFQYFPFKLRADQLSADAHPDENKLTQYMVYNELNTSPTFRSDYSLLPYLMFSPYSPLRLSRFDHSPRRSPTNDNFPYCEAFEDLIRTTQGSPRDFPFLQLLFSPNASQPGYHADNMSWIYKLYSLGLLQQKEVRNQPRLSVFSAQIGSEQLGVKTNQMSNDAQTEVEMYDRFLQWVSSPTAIVEATSAFFNCIEAQENDHSSLPRTVRELIDSNYAKDFRESTESNMRDMRDKIEKLGGNRVWQGQDSDTPQEDKLSKTSQDPERVVSTSTTTEQMTHEDGTVETCITVWKRFSNGRETTTTTHHCEDPASDSNGNIKQRHESSEVLKAESEEKPAKKIEGEKKEKPGWFWN